MRNHDVSWRTNLRITVGIADLKFSKNAEDELITHALGSCLGITVYDPVAKVGGMLHAMLPDSTIDASKAEANPEMFVDRGVPRLFRGAYEMGAEKSRLIVMVAGGATIAQSAENDRFQIGQRNFTMLRKLLWKNSVLIAAQDVGGNSSRTMILRLDTGEVSLKISGAAETLLKAA